MTNDKELVEVWQKQFEDWINSQFWGECFIGSDREEYFKVWLGAKRSRPSVVLPKNAEINHLAVDTAGEYDWNTIEAKEKYMKAFTDGALMICDDIARILTAAGIKYTIEE